MSLEGETYNAGVTLDLFRANEKINAGKKRWLRAEAHKLAYNGDLKNADTSGEKFEQLTHSAIQALFSQNKLVLYERNLPIQEIKPQKEESVPEYICRVLIQLLTMGKIDVVLDINIAFHGDQRVLQDIKLLADSGYGEDDFGNNLPLPENLSYLRR
jgi:hypothetical protein